MAQYQVIYNFQARNGDELNLSEGDVINVPSDQSSAEPGWVYGELDGQYGMVPENYITKLSDAVPEQQNPPESFSPSVLPAESYAKPQPQYEVQSDLCVALYNYESPEAGDLNFIQGDVIQVLTRDGEWWTGQLNGREGIFPATFVKPLDAEVSLKFHLYFFSKFTLFQTNINIHNDIYRL